MHVILAGCYAYSRSIGHMARPSRGAALMVAACMLTLFAMCPRPAACQVTDKPPFAVDLADVRASQVERGRVAITGTILVRALSMRLTLQRLGAQLNGFTTQPIGEATGAAASPCPIKSATVVPAGRNLTCTFKISVPATMGGVPTLPVAVVGVMNYAIVEGNKTSWILFTAQGPHVAAPGAVGSYDLSAYNVFQLFPESPGRKPGELNMIVFSPFYDVSRLALRWHVSTASAKPGSTPALSGPAMCTPGNTNDGDDPYCEYSVRVPTALKRGGAVTYVTGRAPNGTRLTSSPVLLA